MSTGKPKHPTAVPRVKLLADLPAQPVDEKEAEGVKGGISGRLADLSAREANGKDEQVKGAG